MLLFPLLIIRCSPNNSVITKRLLVLVHYRHIHFNDSFSFSFLEGRGTGRHVADPTCISYYYYYYQHYYYYYGSAWKL